MRSMKNSRHLSAKIGTNAFSEALLAFLETGAATEAAELLAQARREFSTLDAGKALPFPQDQAYTLQSLVARHLKSSGWSRLGYKVGATGEAVQLRLGLSSPFWGETFRQRFYQCPDDRALVVQGAGCGLRGVEAEIAFELGRDLPVRLEHEYALGEVADAVEKVMPALEVCASRFSTPPPSAFLIADGAGNGAVAVRADLSLSLKEAESRGLCSSSCVRILVDGECCAEGSGEEVLGHPLESLRFLANAASARGVQLKRGDLIITGATCGQVPLTANTAARAEFEGWGELEFLPQF